MKDQYDKRNDFAKAFPREFRQARRCEQMVHRSEIHGTVEDESKTGTNEQLHEEVLENICDNIVLEDNGGHLFKGEVGEGQGIREDMNDDIPIIDETGHEPFPEARNPREIA